MAKIPGYTVDGVQQYSPENYDDNGAFLGIGGASSSDPLIARSKPAPKKEGPSTLGRILLALGEGVQGFADASSVPNIAGGGGTDVMRGLSHALNKQQERRTERQKMQLQHEMNQANEARARSMAEWYSARPAIEQRKVENAAGVAEDKSKQGWRKIDIANTNANTNSTYKGGMLGVANRNADTNSTYKSTMGDVAKTNAVTGSNKLAVPFGLKTSVTYDDLKNGTGLIPAERADRSPVVNANLDSKEAGTALTTAKTAETKERTSLMPRMMEIRATLARAAMLGAQSSAQRAQIAQDVYGFEYKGEDPDGNPVLLDEAGQRVIPKALEASMKGEKIPASMQTKVAQAHTIVASGEDLIGQINQLASEGKIGPGMGRVQNAKGHFGLLDPEVKALVTNLKNLASLLPAVHGQRGVTAAKSFEETLGGIEQKPESVISGVQEIQKMSRQIVSDNQRVYHPAGGRAKPAPQGGPSGQGKASYTVTAPTGEKTVMQLTPAQAAWYKAQKAQVVANGR